MKHLNKLASLLCAASIGVLALTGCEGADQYDVNSPDWISQKVDSIVKANANKSSDFVIPEGNEDVYTIGATDFSTGWWAQFSKYYQINEGETWNAVFNLNINPSASNTYKNFALIITNDVDRSGDGYTEYGAIRYDYQPSGNSEWGDYIDRECASSNLEFASDTDTGVDKLGGKVVLTVDRSDPNSFTVTINNGTVKKTYSQKSPLTNLNADPENTTIRCFLVPEGSYINFLTSNLEPIGGYTSAEDKQPSSLSLSGVPDEILVGSKVDSVFAGITGTVTFDGVPGSISVANSDLIYSISDCQTGILDEVGEHDLIVIYNKTFKGVNADKPTYAVAKVKVVNELSAYTEKYVCPDPVILGNEDNSTAWWGAHTANIKIEPKQTVVTSFTNYNNAGSASNWNNFVTVLCNADGSKEYSVVRADNYGWGDGYDASMASCDHATDDAGWAAWLATMDGATVTEYITNNGDGTADIKANIVGNDGTACTQTYLGIKVDKDNLYFNYTVDNCHLVFDTAIGTSDCATGWWSAFMPDVQVPAHTVFTTSFTNYTCGTSNWNNFVTILRKVDKTEYAVVRADNYGWGTGYEGHATATTTAPDWAAWLGAMNGAKVDLTVTNNGDGTADVKAVMHLTDGSDCTQTYDGIAGIDGDDFFVSMTVDNSYIEFSPTVTMAKRNAVQVGKRRSYGTITRRLW